MTESPFVVPTQDETIKLSKTKGSLTLKSNSVTLILKPYNTSFQTRTLELKEKAKVRIGRQTSSKTIPSALNGYFDSKVLSRQHAEIWSEQSIVYIKDVKSSNGTFINGERLSAEGVESEPKEIKNKDEIEFGIDIINENGLVMYHKVSCIAYIFPLPLSQIDDSIIKELSNNNSVQVYPDPHLLSRKISTSSLNTISSVNSEIPNNTTNLQISTEGKKSKRLETILLKLQSEIEKSKQVENELKTIKETVVDLERLLSEERTKKSSDLQSKLDQAENTIKSYETKWKYQTQAIQTAKIELKRVKSEYEKDQSQKDYLQKELLKEKQKTKQLEEQLQKTILQRPRATHSNTFLDAFQIRAIQFLFAILIGIISTLVYVLSS